MKMEAKIGGFRLTRSFVSFSRAAHRFKRRGRVADPAADP